MDVRVITEYNVEQIAKQLGLNKLETEVNLHPSKNGPDYQVIDLDTWRKKIKAYRADPEAVTEYSVLASDGKLVPVPPHTFVYYF